MIIDDEAFVIELVGECVRRLFPAAAILSFRNRDTAWRELQHAAPDLLITDMTNDNVPGRTESFGMSGWELLPRLARKGARYPVLVISGSFLMPGIEGRARQCAGPELKVSFLTKPFTEELFRRHVTWLLGSGGQAP